MIDGYAALTEKEKQTLRLLLAGHDAKSMAQHLGLSVHTINERLRDARRKLSVSSSKAAARLLRQAEMDGATPDPVGPTTLGDGAPATGDQQWVQPSAEPHPVRRRGWIIGGSVMTLLLAALLASLAPSPGTQVADTAAAPVVASAATATARSFLALVDEDRWTDSYAAFGQYFRSVNTVAMWQDASEKMRARFGRALSRTLLNDIDTPSSDGSRTVQFRTNFANKAGAVETLSLKREDNNWKVAGIYVE